MTTPPATPTRSVHLPSLLAFDSVARHMNFARAANEHAVTPTAMSKTVKALEAQLGIRLFNRTTRSVALTEAGAQLLATLDDGLERKYAAQRSSGPWRISASTGAAPINTSRGVERSRLTCGDRDGAFENAIDKTYYSVEQKKAYSAGSSTGGRMADMEARKTPNDFVGTSACASARRRGGFFEEWLVAGEPGLDGRVTSKADGRSRTGQARRSVRRRGRVEGRAIDDPRACDVKAAPVRCRAGEAPTASLRQKMRAREVVRRCGDSKGRQLYPGGVPLGSETFRPLLVHRSR